MSTSKDDCPCTVETAEQLAASPTPDRVITLVHGTFARHAPWMREGPLYKALQNLPGKTLFSRFCWTGSNSHTDRLRAGEDLATHLAGLSDPEKDTGKAPHFVVGHSHGGNVMLYALKDEALADRDIGLVTLSTPFITVRRRKLHPLVLLSVLAVGLAMVVETGFFVSGYLNQAKPAVSFLASLAQHPAAWVAVLFLAWLFGTVLSAVLYRGRQFGLNKLFSLLFRRPNAEEIVTGELDRLKLTGDERDAGKKQFAKMLVARPFGDEASMGLVVSQFFSWTQNRILTALGSAVRKFWKFGWFSWIWKLGVVLVLGFLLHRYLQSVMSESVDLVSKLDDWAPGMVTGAIAAVINVLLWGILAVFLLYGLVSLIGLLVLLVAGFAFGLDAMFWNHFASTTAEASPPGPARVYLQSPPPGDPADPYKLAHSQTYEDDKVIKEIVEWIKLRESAINARQ